MEGNEKKASELNDGERPKNKGDWFNPHNCPFFIFADEESAEYDIGRLKAFFSKFKKKKNKE